MVYSQVAFLYSGGKVKEKIGWFTRIEGSDTSNLD